MRYVWLVFAGLVAAMALVLPRLHRRPDFVPSGREPALAAGTSSFAALRDAPAPGLAARADSVVAFGLAQRGTPYVYAGISPETGFDCSGFIMYTFAHFGVPVPHSTALLIDVGRPVPRADAQPGDIVVFTGTDSTSTRPGHAGIVTSRPGEVPMSFVHASSSRREHYVKVSQVEGTDYERRFMQVRRVLGPGSGTSQLATSHPQPTAKPRATAAIAALPARPVTLQASAAQVEPLPKALATKKSLHPAFTKKRVVAHLKTVRKKNATAAKKAPVAKRRMAPKKKVVAPKRATSGKRRVR